MVTRRSYSKSFKTEAVRLLGLGGKPSSQLALELGYICTPHQFLIGALVKRTNIPP
jgi:transposase-like protein